jgi:hypothetical protein
MSDSRKHHKHKKKDKKKKRHHDDGTCPHLKFGRYPAALPRVLDVFSLTRFFFPKPVLLLFSDSDRGKKRSKGDDAGIGVTPTVLLTVDDYFTRQRKWWSTHGR